MTLNVTFLSKKQWYFRRSLFLFVQATAGEGATWGHPPPGFWGFVRKFLFSYLIDAQLHAQNSGRFAFVRQAECAHKTKPRGELLGYKGQILGLLVFGVVAVSRFGGF